MNRVGTFLDAMMNDTPDSVQSAKEPPEQLRHCRIPNQPDTKRLARGGSRVITRQSKAREQTANAKRPCAHTIGDLHSPHRFGVVVLFAKPSICHTMTNLCINDEVAK